MNIAKETGKYLICYCPKHNDQTTPNFYINKIQLNKPIGYGYCFTCGHRQDFTKEQVLEMSKRPVTKTLTCDNKKVDWKKIYKDSLEYPDCLNEVINLSREWMVDPKTLLAMGMGWSHDYNAYTGLMYNEDYEVIGIQLRAKDGFKWCIENSQMGLILPNESVVRPIIITEGRSDSVVAYECEFFPIGKPSAQFGDDLVTKFIEKNNIQNVTIVADDCDKPYKNAIGQRSAYRLCRLLQTRGTTARVLKLYGVKDLKEHYEKFGKDQTRKVLSS